MCVVYPSDPVSVSSIGSFYLLVILQDLNILPHLSFFDNTIFNSISRGRRGQGRKHSLNSANKTIQTFKIHMVNILFSADPYFTPHQKRHAHTPCNDHPNTTLTVLNFKHTCYQIYTRINHKTTTTPYGISINLNKHP